MGSRVGIWVGIVLSVGVLTACSKQDVNTTKTAGAAAEKTVDENSPQSKHSKIKLPDSFPKDLPLPENIQLEHYTAVPEDSAATITGLLAGKMKPRLDALHKKMLAEEWKANLVMPQGKQTLMHYTKDGRNIIIELNESVGDVVKYSVSYDLGESSNEKPKDNKSDANTSNTTKLEGSKPSTVASKASNK